MTTDINFKNVPEIRFKGFNNEWEEKKLGEVARIIGGGTPSTSNKEYWNGDIDWFTPGEIGNVNYVNYSLHKITTIGLKRSSAKILPKGTVLYTSRAGIGKTAILGISATTNQGFQSIVPTGILNSYFVYSLSPKLKKYGNKMGSGSTFDEISGKQLAKFIIQLPSLPEQEKIGSLFFKLDTLIATSKQKTKKLKMLKRALLQKMFASEKQRFPEIRFKGFENMWIIYHMSNLIVKNTCKNKDLLVQNIESISNKYGFIKQTDQFNNYSVASDDLTNYYIIKPGQFSYNPSRINVGSIAYKGLNEKKSIVSPLYISFYTKDMVNDLFLITWFKTKKFEKQRIIYSEGGVRDTLSFLQLSKIIISIPSLPEQEKIGSLFFKLDALITTSEQKSAKLEELKKALLQKMFI